MRNIIVGWVIATYHIFSPELYNLVASEVEAVFEKNNITKKQDKIMCMVGDKLVKEVREFHNTNPYNAFDI